MSFGHGLEWNLNDVKYRNGSKAMITAKDKVYSNFLSISDRAR